MVSNDARIGIRTAGFTLIEILVVVVIMAIVISMAVLSINTTGRDQQLDQESMRIEGLLNLLHDRALVEGRDFGMRIEPGAYQFLYYDGIRGRWLRFDQEREFRHRELPKGVTFQLTLDSVKVVLKPPDPDLVKDDAPLPPPQIAVAASGDSSAFRLTLTREQTNATAAVTSDTTGKVAVENSSHPAEKRT
jgi:general secretion pathway protein H